MNVTSTTSVSTLQNLSSVGATTPDTDADASGNATAAGPAATASISGPGRLFHELKQLSESDPAKFKQVVSDMASSLRADAKNAQGDEATRLSQIADRLDKVAQSGNLSDLAPQRQAGGTQQAHHGHHHGGHHGGGAVMSDLESAFNAAVGNQSTSSSTQTSSADTTSTPQG